MEDATRCCGFGGLFSVKFSDVSAALAEDKIETIRRCRASYVVASDVSCLMQIAGLLNREGVDNIQTLHLAELLDSGVTA